MPLITDATKKLNSYFVQSGYELRFVGGCVRDDFLEIEPKDIDFCTTATPEEMVEMCKKNNLRYIETGLQHGTITIVIDGEPYEVTTLRIDVDTDGRHAVVEYTRNFELDSNRRDFTINAMSMDFDGNIYDYHEGRQDIRERKLRFVGRAEERIEEDYLRILRYFRFCARFDFDPITVDFPTIHSYRERLKNISGERIWSEIKKTLDTRNRRVIRVLTRYGFLDSTGVELEEYAQYTELDDAYTYLTKILISPVSVLKDKWKLSNKEAKLIEFLKDNSEVRLDEDDVKFLINVKKKTTDEVASLAVVCYKHNLINFIKNYQKVDFPVSGKDLLEMGFPAGNIIGERMRDLTRKWIISDYTKTKEELLGIE